MNSGVLATSLFFFAFVIVEARHTTFPKFVQDHARSYTADEYHTRQHLFDVNLAKIEQHNQQPHRRWTAGITNLADRDEAELAALWGWNPTARPDRRAGGGTLSAEVVARRVSQPPLPESFNWTHLKAANSILDQGPCGSCWAFAATSVLRAHSEIYADARMFSAQQIVSCTPNPHNCGGTGGCGGATPELAMDYALENGLVDEGEFPYAEFEGATSPACPLALQPAQGSRIGKDSPYRGGNSIGLVGWEQLPENKLDPVMHALVEKGPLAVSVAATAMWSFYREGIMDNCLQDAVVNHAVALIGFGSDPNDKYWLIQNSWGAQWGDGGRMRMLRRDSEETFCGVDHQPEQGSGCDGGPSEVPVCGTCGILFDSVVPHFENPAAQIASNIASNSLRSLRSAQKHK